MTAYGILVWKPAIHMSMAGVALCIGRCNQQLGCRRFGACYLFCRPRSPDNFIIYANNEFSEKLDVNELDDWLDNLQQDMPGILTLILMPAIQGLRFKIESTARKNALYYYRSIGRTCLFSG